MIDANGLALAHVYGKPPNTVATSPNRLTEDEARRITKLIARLPELIELEKDRNRARSRCKPQPLRFKPVTVGDLLKSGKLLEVLAAHAVRSATSIPMPGASACRSACRCRRWPTISSAASVVPRTVRALIRSGPSRMPECQVTGRYPDFNRLRLNARNCYRAPSPLSAVPPCIKSLVIFILGLAVWRKSTNAPRGLFSRCDPAVPRLRAEHSISDQRWL